MSAPIFFQRPQNMQSAAASKPGANFHGNFGRWCRIQDCTRKKFSFFVVKLALNRSGLSKLWWHTGHLSVCEQVRFSNPEQSRRGRSGLTKLKSKFSRSYHMDPAEAIARKGIAEPHR